MCSNRDVPRDCHAERSNSDREGEIGYDIPYIRSLKRSDTNELIYETEASSETQRMHSWLTGLGENEGRDI